MFCADAGGNPAFSVGYKVSDPLINDVNNLLTPPKLPDQPHEKLRRETKFHARKAAAPSLVLS